MNSYRIPSDVERPDRIVGPFTARQLGLLAGTGLVLLLAWAATRALVSITVFAGLAAPIAAVATAIVLTTRDGLSGDQLLLASLRHLGRDRHLIAAHPGDEHGGAAPRWLTDRAHGPLPPAARPITADTAALPRSITPGSGGLSVVDLGEDGIAVIAAATTINLALRTPAEQAGLVAALGNYLQSLSGHGVQILLRSVRQDVTGHISDLRLTAREMSPELADYARDHAQHLAELADDDTAAQRQVLLVWREPLDPATRLAASVLGGLTARGRHQRRISAHARHAAETRLAARLTDATDMLAPLGIGVRALDEDAATAVVASCTNPANLVPFGAAEAAGPTEIITTGASEYAGVRFDATLTADDEAETETPRGGRRLFGSRAGHRGASVQFAPESLTIGARHLQVGSDFIATIAVTGYPREVTPGWLAPLAAFGGRVDIALHIEPIDPRLAAARLRRQLARLESSLASAAVHNRVGDPAVDVAAEDAAALSAQLARGESRLFRAGLYLTVHANSEDELAAQVGALRTLAASLLIDTCPTSYRAVQAWTATLPLGLDPVRLHRTFDSHALAAAVPFASAQLPPTDPVSVTPAGVLYGRDGAAGLLFHDRFGPAMHNHNEVILGRSGSGKSYLSKTSILRSLYRGIETLVIDPEDEYAALCDALGGTHIRLGAPGVCLNLFDLDIHYGLAGHRTAPADALIRRKLYLHTVIAVLLGEQTPTQRAALDTAVTATYAAAGITDDPASWVRPAPTLSMLRDQLAAGSPVAVDLAAGLAPYVAGGAFAGLLDGASTHDPSGALTVYSLRDLPEELRTIGTLLALDATWRRVSDPGLRRPRSVVVDEAWLLMRQRAGAEFLARLAKSARKYFVGLTVATQDAADVLASDLGKAIVANSATQVLLRQAPQAIDEVGDAFALSEGERRFLLAADRGQGLICTGVHQRTVFASVASAAEHQLATSSPEYDLYDTDEPDYQHLAPGAIGSEIDLGPDEFHAGIGDEDAGADLGDDLGPDGADTQETR